LTQRRREKEGKRAFSEPTQLLAVVDFIETMIKGELRELAFYFRKIPLHQQKLLVVSGLSN